MHLSFFPKSSLLGLLALALLLSSCGKNAAPLSPDLASQSSQIVSVDVIPPHQLAPEITQSSLEGKTPEDLVSAKYKKAKVQCSLFVLEGSSLQAQKQDQFSWNFLSSSIWEFADVLMAKDISLGLQLKKVTVEKDAIISMGDSSRRRMIFSPLAQISIRFKSVNKTINLREKIPTLVMSSDEASVEKENSSGKKWEVNCLLDTESKPEYSDQYQILKKE